MKYIDPQGERVFRGDSRLPRPTVTATNPHVLKVGQPYGKEIDLSRLMSFERTGVYRVQLTFNNSAAVKRNDGQWTGFFSGETFSIEIAP